MQRTTRNFRRDASLAVLPLALAAVFAGPDALASGFQLKENSVQGLGRSFAGDGAAPGDCAVVVNNPAAMGDIGAVNCAQADINVIDFKTEFSGAGTDFLGNPLTGGNGGNAGATKAVPAMYFTHKLNDQWTFGASVNAPFGLQTSYPDGWVGRYEALYSKLESIDLNFAASFKVNDEFSIGGSIIAQRTKAELTQAIDFGTVLASATNGQILPQEADGFGGLKGDDWAYGFDVGLLWKPTASDRIGLNYHSEIDHTISGDGTFLVPSNILPLLGGAFVDTSGQADFKTPWFVSATWWHTLDERLSFGANISYTHWSSFQQLVVQYANPLQPDSASTFNWDDTWLFSIGGDYRLDDRWTLRAGIAYDQTPTYDATRTPRVPDGDRRWISLGVGYRVSDQFKVDAGYLHVFVDDANINHTSPTFSQLVGVSKGSVNVFGISGQYLF